MKTVGRILIILTAALIVVGATWAVGQNSSTASTFVRRERPEAFNGEGRPAPPDDAFRDGEFRGRGVEHHAAQPLSLRGWLGFTQTLVPIALIIAIVALPMSLWKRYHRSKRREASTLPV